MRRREFITFFGGTAAAWPLAARAQRANVVKRIGWLAAGTEQDPLEQARIRAFVDGLAKLGWKEGANFRLNLRVSNLDVGARRRVAAELVATAPDVILCAGTQTTAILQELTSTIPIVFVNVADPVASGFVASFSVSCLAS